jgi:hypothetical protein
MKKVTHPDTYQCEVCRMQYKTPDDAVKCEASKPEQKFRVDQKIDSPAFRKDANTTVISASMTSSVGPQHEWEYQLSSKFEVETDDFGYYLSDTFSEAEIETLIKGYIVHR